MEDTLESIVVIILAIIFLAGFFAFCGWFVAFLWNAVIPTIFGLTAINFKQGLALFLLCRWLFCGFGILNKLADSKK